MRLVKYVISVSKRHENNHAGVKNGVWMIYYYDEDGKIQTKRINPLLIWYYKLRKRQRTKAVCSESITDNITVDENENEDSLGKIVSSALIGLIAMKFKQYTKFDT